MVASPDDLASSPGSTMSAASSTAVASSPPAPTSAPTPTLPPTPRSQVLVRIETHGGLCRSADGRGQECRSTVEITENGASSQGRTVPAKELSALFAAVQQADYRALAARRFTGTCPTAYDGQEIVYHFFVGQTEHVLDSCREEIDAGAPLFKALTAARAAGGF
jgi:hypothetical protein